MRLAFAIILFAAISSSIAQPTATGSPAPEWTLKTSDGSELSFKPGRRDSHSLLLFWATWCPYCRALMPHLEELRASLSDSEMEVLALNIWEDGDPQRHLDESGMAFTLLPQAEAVAELYGVKGTPGLFLVDKKGTILYQRRSGSSPEEVVKAIRAALATGLSTGETAAAPK